MTRKPNSENDLVSASGASAIPPRRPVVSRKRAKHSSAAAEPAIPESVVAVPPAVTEPAVSEPVTAAPAPVATTPADDPTREQIARRAYLYWEARGYQGGSPEEDWLRAERELRANAATA